MPKSPKIAVSVSNDLETDQRVHKVCQLLLDMGGRPVLLGRLLPQSRKLERPYPTRRFRLPFRKGPLFYVSLNIRLFFHLVFNKFDAYLANDLDTLAPNFLAARIRRKPLVYDSHEFFTQVPELQHRKLTRAIWERLERLLLPHILHAYTVSPSIAEAYLELYGVKFMVVRNLPVLELPKEDESLPDEFETWLGGRPMLLYQGALNLGRGVELMVDAMRLLDGFALVLAGQGDRFEALRARAQGLDDRVRFLGRVEPERLRAFTRRASLGFSLERDMGLNYRFALPNKLFDYLAAGVPVLVSDLPEMARIVRQWQVGQALRLETPEQLAQAVAAIFAQPQTLESWSRNALAAAQSLNWQGESQVLRQIWSRALPGPWS